MAIKRPLDPDDWHGLHGIRSFYGCDIVDSLAMNFAV